MSSPASEGLGEGSSAREIFPVLAPPADSWAAGEEEEECVKAAKEEKTFTGAAAGEHRCVADGRTDADGGVGGGGGLHSGFSPGIIPEV